MNLRHSTVRVDCVRIAVRRSVSDAALLIVADLRIAACAAALEKLFRVEKHAIRELAMLMPETRIEVPA